MRTPSNIYSSLLLGPSLMVLLLSLNFIQPCAANEPAPIKQSGTLNQQPSSSRWLADYDQALKQAKTDKKMALLLFYNPQSQAQQASFEAAISVDANIKRLGEQFVFVKLPVNSVFSDSGETKKILDFEAFAELQNQAGIAMIDYRDPKSPHFEIVVTIYPFLGGDYISVEHLAVLLDLPTGSLTQRTLVFAVRSHPDHPASANSDQHPALAAACKNHSLHQAKIEQQGHHNWNRRFHRLNALLPKRMASQEVCSESWPRQRLFQAARECVSSWRKSSGHWEAVSSKQSYFAYDMKRGENGVWYATGIFARPQ